MCSRMVTLLAGGAPGLCHGGISHQWPIPQHEVEI